MRWLVAVLTLPLLACGDDAEPREDTTPTTSTAPDTSDAPDVVDVLDSVQSETAETEDATADGGADLEVTETLDDVDDDAPEAEVTGVCNDGVPDPGEDCDDGDDDDLDGCDRACQVTRVVRRPAPGEVVVAELMIDPVAVPDTRGEWLELVSVAGDEINLGGCVLRDDGTDRIELDADGGVALAAGDLYVVGNGGDPADNGGVAVDHVYVTMLLDNVGDELVLECDGVEIDRVAWTPFVWPVVAGRALALDPTRRDAAANDLVASWCLAERAYGDGDRGTPGVANPSCPQLDDAIDSCRLLPANVTALAGFAGAPTALTVEVGEAGITDATEGLDPSPSLVVEVGWGPIIDGEVAPPEGLAWTWTRAAGDATIDTVSGADGYRGAVVVPDVGTVAALGRASRDGGATWRLCGKGGGLPAVTVPLVVAASPCEADTCTSPDAAVCDDDGVTLLGFEPIGQCTPIDEATWSCAYEPLATDCGADDRACTLGACAGTPRRPTRGEVIITELMLTPTGGVAAQWLELESQVDEPLMLTGCVLEASDPDAVYPFSLVLPTVLGRQRRLVVGASKDLAVNGGAPVDRAWGEAVVLATNDGAVTLTCDGEPIDEVAWEVPPWPVQTGRSVSLSPFRKDLDDNDAPTSWCTGQASFGAGDRGSPGVANASCPGDVVPVEACSLLGPASLTPPAGASVDIAVRVIADSITGKTRQTDPAAALIVEVGLTGRDQAPATITSWSRAAPDLTWSVPTNQGIDADEDRYLARPRMPAPGAWDLYARATADGGNTWVVCDRTGLTPPATARDPIAVDPVASACDPDPCGAPPEPDCDGDDVITYALPSACVIEGGAATCGFAEAVAQDCAAAGAICEAGACTRFPRAPTAGELVVSELLIVPAPGELGEWIELQNTTDEPIDLSGCGLRSGPSETFDLAPPPLPLAWVVMPHATVVLARSLAPNLNGGITARAAWTGISLGNTADWLQLVCAGVVIDTVAWDIDDDWTVPVHRSLQLSGSRMDAAANDFPTSFCAPAGMTPGVANLTCPADDDLVESCTLELPADTTIAAGEALTGAVVVRDVGVTDLGAGPDLAYGTIVELGFGPRSAGPIGSFVWSWQETSADATPRDDGTDRWVATLTPASPGDFVVAGRVSLDGGASWTLCDRSGLDDGFAPDASLVVTPSPCAPNPCTSTTTPTCSGGTLTADADPGTCVVEDGAASCTWSAITFSCGPYGGCNSDGACNTPPRVPAAGELVITEVMRDSTLPAPDRGEWIELSNVAGVPLDLRGCVITDGLGEVVPIASPLPQVVPSGGWAVFVQLTDKNVNGGVQPTSGALRSLAGMVLGNVADTAIVTCAGVEIDRVTWGVGWPGSTGVAMQLSRPKTNATDNDLPGSWCAANVPYGLIGNKGSPGLDNPTCP